MAETTGAGAPVARDTARTPEAKDSRQEVIDAFTNSYSLLETTPDDQLSEEEKWIKKSIKDVKEQTIDKGKDKFTVEFENHHTGQVFTQREGIPVEGLIGYLDKKLSALPTDAPERQNLERWRVIIAKNSKSFHSFPRRMDPTRFEGRVHHEAYFIFRDSRATGNDHDDWFKALDTLNGRLELIIPKAKTPIEPEPEPTPEPEPEPEPSPEPPVEEDKETPGEEEPEQQPQAIEDEEKPKSIQEYRYDALIGNIHESTIKMAHLEARQDVTESLGRGKWWQAWHWPRKIGLRLIEPAAVLNRRLRLQKVMIDNNTSLLDMGMARNPAGDFSRAKSEAAIQQEAIVNRFKEGGVKAGEKMEAAEGELKTMIVNEIFGPITKGEITTPEQVREQLAQFVKTHLDDPQVERLFGTKANDFGEVAEYFATDVLQTGINMKADMELNGKTLDQIGEYINITLANARSGHQTETRDLVDKAVAWANRRKARVLANGAKSLGYRGVILNPAVVGVSTALATSGAMRALGVAGKATALPSFFVGAGAGALMAGARRYYELGVYDRPQQMAESALGEYKKGQQRAPRRDKLEEYQYNRANSTELRNGGGTELISGKERKSGDDLLSLDLTQGDPQERLQKIEDIARRIAEIKTRYNLSSELHIDLVGFQNRLHADVAPLEDTRLQNNLSSKLRDYFELQQKDAGASPEEAREGAVSSLDEITRRFSTDWTEKLIENKDQQDKAFKGYRVRNALGSAAFAGAAGLGVGFAGKEILENTGVGEFIRDRFSNPSPLPPEAPPAAPTPSTETVIDISVGHQTRIPEGASWIPDDKPGVFDLKGPDGKTWVEDANFRSDGFVEYNQEASIAKVINQIQPEGAPSVEIKPVTGPDGLWNENATQTGHREWYAYDTPTSERNELQFYTQQDGDAVTLDASHMQEAWQTGLNPEHINVQDSIKNKELAWAFNLAGEDNKQVIILDGADGAWDGELRLDPNASSDLLIDPSDPNSMKLSDFSKIIINQEALHADTGGNATEFNNNLGVWNVGGVNGETGFISAGRLVEGENGEKVWQSFATIRGTGELPAGIEEIVPGRPSYIPEISAPPGPEVPPPPLPPVEDFEVPIIPIPFAPRHPLEPLGPSLIPPELPPPMYYGGANLETLRQWLIENPNRLHPYRKRVNPDGTVTWTDQEGKPVLRNVERERDRINTYLHEINNQNPEYYNFLEAFTKGENMAPMTSENRVSVNIPAWMEGKNLYNVLGKYVKQIDKESNPLNPDLFEINVIVNRRKGTPADESVAEIQRFIADSKKRGENYHINFVDVEFDPPFNNVGHARKVITDLTLLRYSKRGKHGGPLYIESEDADLLHVDPKTVANLIEKFDNNPYLDAARGIQDRFPEELMRNDFLFLSRRLWDYTENFLRRKGFRPENNPDWNFTWHRVITGGWNTGYTAEAYALIGGYDSRQTKGEDMTIGEKMTMIRGDGNMPNLEVVGKVPTRSDSSPRRFLSELITGKGAYTEAFEDEKLNEFIKNASLDELQQKVSPYSRITDTNKGNFAGMFEGHLNAIRNLTPNEDAAREMFNSVMFWTGFKKEDYEYRTDGKLEIKNFSNVQAALNNYRTNHLTPRKTGERTRRKTN